MGDALAAKSSSARQGALLVVAALVAAACAPEGPARGSVMLVVETNVTPGRDFDTLRLRVEGDASREVTYHYGWSSLSGKSVVVDGGYLPFTFNVQNARDGLEERRVSVTAWKGGAPVFARDARFVVPTRGVKELRLRVDALCFPPLAAEAAKPHARPEAGAAGSCADGETCVAGGCASDHVDASALREYTPEAVFGGSSGPGYGGTCVNALACFARRPRSSLAPVDESRLAQVVEPFRMLGECALDARLLGGRDDLAIAVQIPDTLGVCSYGDCLALLERASDRAALAGWSLVAGRIVLPAIVCDRRLRVYVRAGADDDCVLTTPQAPACGDASSLAQGEWLRDEPPIAVEGGGLVGVVCSNRTPSSELCAKAQVGCGELLVDDPLCALPLYPAMRYAQCGRVCASRDTAGMRVFDGGTRLMGAAPREPAAANEAPQHPAYVRAFALDTTEVTAGAFEAWCDGRGRQTAPCADAPAGVAGCNYRAGRPDHPMNCVTWIGANAYCAAQGKRLPTEEEWEFAARGGNDTRTYPWGRTLPNEADLVCWSGSGTARVSTCPVGTSTGDRTADGVMDLGGGVREWTSSGYSESYEVRTTAKRVTRGGAWSTTLDFDLRGVRRRPEDPTSRRADLGFRCAR